MPRYALPISEADLDRVPHDDEPREPLPVADEFCEDREARHTPTNTELRQLTLEESESREAEPAMTGNDAFGIIEMIKEREAARRG